MFLFRSKKAELMTKEKSSKPDQRFSILSKNEDRPLELESKGESGIAPESDVSSR